MKRKAEAGGKKAKLGGEEERKKGRKPTMLVGEVCTVWYGM